MKRKLPILLTLCLMVIISILGLCGCNLTKIIVNEIREQQIVNDGVYIVEKGEITGLTEEGKKLKEHEIPSEIKGQKIEKIASHLFAENEEITSVKIAEGITSIGSFAFNECKNLKEIEIPNSVATLSYGICDNAPLEKVTTPANLLEYLPNEHYKTVVITGGESIDAYAFRDCSTLTSLTIKNGVKSIGLSALYMCTSLQEVVLPNSLEEIGELAFSHCNSLENVTLPTGLKTIGNNAFFRSTAIKEINIPDSVTSIGNYAFQECMGLKTLSVGKGVVQIGSFIFDGCSIEIASVPTEFIKEIRNTSLKRITINDGENIVENALKGCEELTTVSIGESVKSIGEKAFYGCTSLSTVEIANGVTTIGESAFSTCTNLSSINLPDSVNSIGDSAFSGCSKLVNVNMGNGVTSIGSYAFSSCSNLPSIVLSRNLTSIGCYAFSNCSVLESVIFEGVSVSDTKAWFITTSASNWQNKSGGTLIDVTNQKTNAENFTSAYGKSDYWYKK